MNFQKYDLLTNRDVTLFRFKSKGINGETDKGIVYKETKNETIYNLAFGDLIFDPIQKEYFIDDLIVSDNGDRNKILATVAKSAYIFSERYPNRIIFFKGSTKSRTRLYRRVISLNLKELSETFYIFGAEEDESGNIFNIPFQSNVDFFGFFIKRK
ncbi:DUF6934 family protein [Flavobacterium ginsenosidimutans]|uniref:Uncharacterized protein n=1 Tax=Flavobacterium ginsenosidimutans TaxID=687844 RepID=A0ABZ2Q938_9FLAO